MTPLWMTPPTTHTHTITYIGIIFPAFSLWFGENDGTSWSGWTGTETVDFGFGQARLKLVVFPLNAFMLKVNFAEASTSEKSGFKDIL